MSNTLADVVNVPSIVVTEAPTAPIQEPVPPQNDLTQEQTKMSSPQNTVLLPPTSPTITNILTQSVQLNAALALPDDDGPKDSSLNLLGPTHRETSEKNEALDSSLPNSVRLLSTNSKEESKPPVEEEDLRQESMGPIPPPVYAVNADRDHRSENLGKELAPDSSVWHTYINAASIHDAEMVDGWNKGLDVLLISASLFSAVVTAFVVESSKLLQPDYTRVNALLTAHMLNALANGGNASHLTGIPSPAALLNFEKPVSATMINILWYAALGFGLGSVLVAMLAKQWLNSYVSQQQAEPYTAACERQRRFDNLHEWSLPHVMAILPVLLHKSLFLFLIGLVIYLWELDSGLSKMTCIIVGILFAFYFATGALAVFNSTCPYITPLSQFVHSCLGVSRRSTTPSTDVLVPRAMLWLASTRDPNAVSSALQALAGLRRGYARPDIKQAEPLAKLAFDRLRGCFVQEWEHRGTYSLRTEMQHEASHYARTLMNIVDDTRTDPRTFSAILNEPSLPEFMLLLGKCPNKSVALLTLCSYQRLLHRIDLAKRVSTRALNFDRSSSQENLKTGIAIRNTPATENMAKIVGMLMDYIKGHIFLEPISIEIAVETIGFAPQCWVVAILNSSLEQTLLPLFHLLSATRDGILGVRPVLARTLAILAEIHANQADSDAARFENALSIADTIEHGSDTTQELLLRALSHFAGQYKKESDKLTADTIRDELLQECDGGLGLQAFQGLGPSREAGSAHSAGLSEHRMQPHRGRSRNIAMRRTRWDILLDAWTKPKAGDILHSSIA